MSCTSRYRHGSSVAQAGARNESLSLKAAAKQRRRGGSAEDPSRSFLVTACISELTSSSQLHSWKGWEAVLEDLKDK